MNTHIFSYASLTEFMDYLMVINKKFNLYCKDSQFQYKRKNNNYQKQNLLINIVRYVYRMYIEPESTHGTRMIEGRGRLLFTRKTAVYNVYNLFN